MNNFLFFVRKKNVIKIQQLEESFQAAQSKASNLEKLKNRLNGEVEDLTANLDDVSIFAVLVLK